MIQGTCHWLPGYIISIWQVSLSFTINIIYVNNYSTRHFFLLFITKLRKHFFLTKKHILYIFFNTGFQVIQETLRTASILSFTFREAVQDVEFEGYYIPKGWKVLPLFRTIHHCSDFFPQPEKFDPSRFEVRPRNIKIGPINEFIKHLLTFYDQDSWSGLGTIQFWEEI